MTHAYTRYLAAKKTVDDRSLNRHVTDVLRTELSAIAGPLRVLEIGAGLGTMVARLVEWGLLSRADYTLLDVDRQSLDDSRAWLTTWASDHGYRVSQDSEGLRIVDDARAVDILVRTTCAEITAYLEGANAKQAAHLVIANAFLDVVDVPSTLPGVFKLVAPGGLYWFSINFDGETIFQPDHPLDAPLMAAYHRTMDERVRYGRPAGESRCGRHLYAQLRAQGVSVLASGSSDWVVHPAPDSRYQADEAYFVDFILQTIDEALTVREEVSKPELQGWLKARRQQLEAGELLYIAHQIDYCGRVP